MLISVSSSYTDIVYDEIIPFVDSSGGGLQLSLKLVSVMLSTDTPTGLEAGAKCTKQNKLEYFNIVLTILKSFKWQWS